MLFYIKCPSCSRIISENLDKYYEDYNELLENRSMTKKDKEEELSKLLIKYKIDMICCRIRVMTTPQFHDYIV